MYFIQWKCATIIKEIFSKTIYVSSSPYFFLHIQTIEAIHEHVKDQIFSATYLYLVGHWLPYF